jgi:hypothetical protein
MRASIAAVLMVAACGEAFDSSTPTDKTGTFAAQVEAAHVRMHVRFEAARRVEDAIAHSDLERARTAARIVDSLDEPEIMPQWMPFVADVRDAARQVVQSGDVVAASSSVAILGARCAACHVAIVAHVTFPNEPRPETTGMVGHQWAAAQMWEGLIGPADDRWLNGAQALTTVPLNMVARAATPTSPDEIDDVARIRLFARRALTAKTLDARADVYGKLLSACADCHAKLRDR